ncbi:MAG: beta-lactamase family protein [Rhodospirillales bacterium]|nr:beta-lactamase family protein [Rhodospirillales bacterium]
MRNFDQIGRVPNKAIFLLISLLCVLPFDWVQADTFPGKTWTKLANPESQGWSSAKLKKAKAYSEVLDTAAVMIVHDGVLIDSWGEISRKFPSASIRKSLLSALIGIQEMKGKIHLTDTLEKLNIQDFPAELSRSERQARVVDLLMARSGVYHEAAGETSQMKYNRPSRGSHEHGEYWYYNNWDFNALGTIYEAAIDEKIPDSLAKFIAAPLQMQDFDIDDVGYFHEKISRHPAFYIRTSARDLARFGLMYLKEGRWMDRQIIPPEWVRNSTSLLSNITLPSYTHTDKTSPTGYGYMWWVFREGGFFPSLKIKGRAFFAHGYRGQFLIVIPAQNLVVVHLVNKWDPTELVSFDQMGNLLSLILEAAPQ